MSDINKRIAIIDEKLSMLIKMQSRETWVRVSVIQRLTGWDAEDLRMARQDGLVKYKKIEVDGKETFRYLLESIPPILLTKKSA